MPVFSAAGRPHYRRIPKYSNLLIAALGCAVNHIFRNRTIKFRRCGLCVTEITRLRHCERSEAIQEPQTQALPRRSGLPRLRLAMTAARLPPALPSGASEDKSPLAIDGGLAGAHGAKKGPPWGEGGPSVVPYEDDDTKKRGDVTRRHHGRQHPIGLRTDDIKTYYFFNDY